MGNYDNWNVKDIENVDILNIETANLLLKVASMCVYVEQVEII